MTPTCEIVENASIRFTCRCDRHMKPPTSALAAPMPSSRLRMRKVMSAEDANADQ